MVAADNWVERLQRYPDLVLQQLRWLVAAGGVLALFGLSDRLRVEQIVVLLVSLLLLAGWGACLSVLDRRGVRISPLIQLAVDGGLLVLALFALGGAGNPAVSYLLVPVALAAILLSPRGCAVMTAWFIGLYTLLLFYHYPLHSLHPEQHAQLSAHVVGMWLIFCISAAVLALLLNGQAQTALLAREQLQTLREQQLRDENVLAVATLAAGAAHELGTPLTTLGMGLEELEQSVPEPLRAECQLLRQQVARCQRSLYQLAETARRHQAGERHQASVADFFERVLHSFQVLMPTCQCQLLMDASLGQQQALWPLTFEQALLNLLNNAARVDDCLQLRVQRCEQWLVVQLTDRGPGIAVPQSRYRLQASREGLGMGLLLTHASIEQLGGVLRVHPAEAGGTVAEIRLPLTWAEAC